MIAAALLAACLVLVGVVLLAAARQLERRTIARQQRDGLRFPWTS